MKKRKSLYQQGLQPHVFSVRRNRGWEPFVCEDVLYTANSSQPRSRTSSDSIRPDQHTLSFTYHVILPDDEIYFAYYPPYTYSMLNGFLARLEGHASARRHFQRSELARSIGQLPVPLLVVTQDITSVDAAEVSAGAPSA